MSVVLLNQTLMNFNNLPTLINSGCSVDYAIQVTEDSHEDDNFSFGSATNYCLTINQNLPGSRGPYIISGISPSIWQPPE